MLHKYAKRMRFCHECIECIFIIINFFFLTIFSDFILVGRIIFQLICQWDRERVKLIYSLMLSVLFEFVEKRSFDLLI
jgi:hypothetical protein